MINIKELKGNFFKKEFNLFKCRYGYHNKNNSGGNFGLDFYLNEKFNELTDFTLDGDYNIKGEIFNLKIRSIRAGLFVITIPKEKQENLELLKDFLKIVYNQLRKELVIENLNR